MQMSWWCNCVSPLTPPPVLGRVRVNQAFFSSGVCMTRVILAGDYIHVITDWISFSVPINTFLSKCSVCYLALPTYVLKTITLHLLTGCKGLTPLTSNKRMYHHRYWPSPLIRVYWYLTGPGRKPTGGWFWKQLCCSPWLYFSVSLFS